MAWINEETGKMYYAGSITISHNGVLFSGIPSVEQLTDWGFVEYIPPQPPEPQPPTPEDELDDFEALQIITEGGTQ